MEDNHNHKEDSAQVAVDDSEHNDASYVAPASISDSRPQETQRSTP